MPTDAAVTTEEEEVEPVKEEPKTIPNYGTKEWIYWWSESEGYLPTPIDVCITGSIVYTCPELKWYNFDVYPHKIRVTNTGYTVLVGAKWKTERPYLVGGPLLEKHVLSQIHFHWGATVMEGSDHTVDKISHPGEMQVSFFKSEYLTQEEALRHYDGVMMVCYIIKFGVEPDERLGRIIEGFSKVKEANSHTRIGPYPMSQILPMFSEDYFLYWGAIPSIKENTTYAIRWVVPRTTLYATAEQIKEFRKLWDPWDEPNMGNFRPLQHRKDRHVFLINPHWNLYNSLLPIPRVPEPSISVLSPVYEANLWMLPPQNAYMIPVPEEKIEEDRFPYGPITI